MQEALQSLMREIADMKLLSDADIPWLIQLENMVIERVKRPVQEMAQQGAFGGSQMGSPAGSMQGGGLMAGTQMPPQGQGEMERMLAAGQPGL